MLGFECASPLLVSNALILSAIELLQPLMASSSNGFFSIVRGIPPYTILLPVPVPGEAAGGGGGSFRLLRNEFLLAWNGLCDLLYAPN